MELNAPDELDIKSKASLVEIDLRPYLDEQFENLDLARSSSS